MNNISNINSTSNQNNNYILQIDSALAEIIYRYVSLEEIKDKNPTFETDSIRAIINKNKKCPKSYKNFLWIYERDFISMDEFLKDKTTKRFFIKEFPELLLELDNSNNFNFDIKSVTIGSDKIAIWKCLKNTSHILYSASFATRCKGHGCKMCADDKMRIHQKEDKDKHIAKLVDSINSVEIGDRTEEYIVELLLSMQCYLKVEKLGETSEKCDIRITLQNGSEKSIQVKTLTNNSGRDQWYFKNSKTYDNNMLIVMVNKDRNRFACEYAGNITVKNLSLSFSAENSKYKNIMFTNIEEFKMRLYQNIPFSCDYKLDISKDISKEYAMLERLKSFCFRKGITYTRNTTNSNTIDVFINGVPIQAKYCSFPKDTNRITYSVSFHKSAGILNGKNISRPYSINDPFEYVIVEVGGIRDGTEFDLTRYHNKFCSIPKLELINRKILSSDNCPGKSAFSVCPPDYVGDHWSKKYWYTY